MTEIAALILSKAVAAAATVRRIHNLMPVYTHLCTHLNLVCDLGLVYC
jgi:hypothetical protein